jgi:hypothetical protein
MLDVDVLGDVVVDDLDLVVVAVDVVVVDESPSESTRASDSI